MEIAISADEHDPDLIRFVHCDAKCVKCAVPSSSCTSVETDCSGRCEGRGLREDVDRGAYDYDYNHSDCDV